MTRLAILAALFWFLTDQGSKWVMLKILDLNTIGRLEVFPPYLNFVMGWNRGINFGLFAGSPDALRWVLVAVSVAVSVWLFLWARRMAHPLGALGAGSVIGGALGNGLDRAYHGAVVDFLNMSCCGITNPYTFNIADIGIFGGVALLVFFGDKTHNKA